MKGLSRFIVLTVISCSLSACFNMKVQDPGPGTGQVMEARQSFFGFGLYGEKEVALNKSCPQGVKSFGDGFTGEDIALTVASVGLYSPRTVKYECLAPQGGMQS